MCVLGHVGSSPCSHHDNAVRDYHVIFDEPNQIVNIIEVQNNKEKERDTLQLRTSIAVVKWLTFQSCAFRGHDETPKSRNRGNFIELIKLLTEFNPEIAAVVLENSPRCIKYTSHQIQQEILSIYALKVRQYIRQEIGDSKFSILVDETCDASKREQMAVVIRYVDTHGLSNERFVGVLHVEETTSAYLKSKIDFIIAKLGLSLQQVRGQGYDGASNMAGEFNGLQAKIMRENSSAYFVHCFAHKLNLVVVAIAKKIFDVGDFFDMISLLVTVVGSSCKRKDKLRENHREEVRKAIGKGEIATGSGLNQELSLQRPGDTRWNSHYTTLLSLSKMFPSVIKVLEYVEEEGSDATKQRQASGLLKYFQSFDSTFFLHMMMIILALTNGLSKTFQRKDMDIVNAISDVESAKQELDKLRSQHGWNSLLSKVCSFCDKLE